MVSPDVVNIWSEYFVVFVVRIYIYVRLVMPSDLFCCVYFNVVLLYLLQWCHMLSKTRSSGSLHRVIGEVSVLGLLVVVYKIPYSSSMFNTANGLEPGKCVPIIPLSIWYNVCAFHSPVYHYITATAVYLVQRTIAVCVVVIWSKSLYLSRMNSQRGRWVCLKSSNTRWKSVLIWNTYTRYHICGCKM